MRDSDERTRHFITKNKRQDNLDEPSARRAVGKFGECESSERKCDADDDTFNSTDFLVRRRSKDRYKDEENYIRPKRKLTNSDYEEYDEYQDEIDNHKRAPILVRVFAWIALLAIFFVCGYIGANYFFSWADKKGGPRVGRVLGSGSEIRQMQQDTSISSTSGNAKYKLYFPDGGKIITREIDIRRGMVEEDIEKVVSMYVDGLKETKMLDNTVNTLNIFRNGDWLYLDMTSAFQSSLKKLGKDKAMVVIGGLVKTMQDNFPPIKKIKFYIDGKDTSDKTPVDLTIPWGIN